MHPYLSLKKKNQNKQNKKGHEITFVSVTRLQTPKI
jgi:hypothetical protein